jgi:hypothetical protein
MLASCAGAPCRPRIARFDPARRHAIRLAAAITAAASIVVCSAATASASSVVFVGPHGHAWVRDDPFLPPSNETRWPGLPASGAAVASSARSSDRTVRSVLAHLEKTRQITRPSYLAYSRDFNGALNEVRQLSSARGDELEAVIENLHTIAVNGSLTTSRLPVLFLTLDRNRQYWRTGAALSYGQRVEFAGSELVWEYYPGQGIELQQLGSFGKADGLCTAGAADEARCRTILSELIPLAVRRGGGLTWEYYFQFDGGVPPWTSAMSQGTAIQALADAYKETGDRSYLAVAHSALPVFGTAPPAGVGVKTYLGMRYVQYSFASAPGEEVINAFVQSLIGLDDYAQASGDPVAQRLFKEGDAEAQAELPRFNTGAWSLYQPGLEDDLSYHQLVTGFLQQLCSMTKTPIYCTTAAAFQLDLKTPPHLKLVTTSITVNHATEVYFTVSKISRVGITIIHGTKTVFLTSASFPHGEHYFAIPALKPAGTYTVQLDATDLAGNYNQISTLIQVSK